MAVRKHKEAAATVAKAPTRTETAVKPETSVKAAAPAKETDPLAGTVVNEVARVVAGTVTPAQAKTLVPDAYVQYMGKDVSVKDMMAEVRRIWEEELGHKGEEIADMKLYFRTEINRCYFVINGEVSGSVAM